MIDVGRRRGRDGPLAQYREHASESHLARGSRHPVACSSGSPRLLTEMTLVRVTGWASSGHRGGSR
jgi:hypothetical protein